MHLLFVKDKNRSLTETDEATNIKIKPFGWHIKKKNRREGDCF